VLNWLRAKQADGVALSIRKVGNSGIVDIKQFYQLFPGGPLKISSKIAGIPKPVSCI
jgi:tRNA 2-thiouridine synthesizing protein E